MNKISASIFLAMAVMTAIFLPACGDNPKTQTPTVATAPAAKTEPTPVKKELPVLRAYRGEEVTSPILFYIGDSLGFFQEYGVKVNVVGVLPAGQLVAAVVSGKLDIGGAHVNRTIAGISAGASIKAVVASTETSQRIPHMVGITNKNSPIKKSADLVGKKVGLARSGGCHEYTPYAYLKKNGVPDPKNSVEIIILPERILQQALRQGEIDLAMMHRTPEQIEQDGEFDILFSDYDVWGIVGGATPTYFSRDFIKENPEVVRSYVNGMAKTINWANANPYESRRITAERTNTPIDEIHEGLWAKDGIIHKDTVTMWVDLLKEFGEIKNHVEAEQVYTNEFNNFALNQGL
ncbi:MAG: ABC transporter substrate-binding protein [Deltaproteobacteria bacterium]|jgi:ABC-type nitrate/sulfonate/bicarbonate transport system substrate-binding protein|nr:ABC transporter substrate-binding protein [Deltaproteobacteria bacterium]